MKKIFTVCLATSFALTAKLASAQTQVTFYTTKGTFVATMEDVKKPITTTNFENLVKAKFYDGIIFHRVVKGFVIQGGDPTGTGTGGSGTTIPDELQPPVSNLQKTLGMATSGPNTATSQFYINMVNNTFLDPNYTVFGTVITNFAACQVIENVPVNSNNKPLTNVVMDSVRITVPTAVYDMGSKSENIEIFPNPISDESVVSIISHSNQTAKISIYNQLGEIQYCGMQTLTEGINNISLTEIHMNNLAKGMYYLTVGEGSGISQRTFIRIQ
jgi:cyclophilin family peptidyl-prolyl cis-trans isomerase